MKNIFFLFLHFIIVSFSFSQNRLNESNFEAGIVNEYPICRDKDYINDRFEYWKSEFSNKCFYRRIKFTPKVWASAGYTGDHCPCGGGGNHSPDYRAPDYQQQGHSIGISSYELIQQKLTNNNELESDKFYKVSFKIKIPRIHSGTVMNGHENAFIKFMLAKNKVQYMLPGPEYSGKATLSMCDADGILDENYDETATMEYHPGYADYIPNDIIEIHEERLIEHPFDEWIQLEFAFKMPEEGVFKHNWFTVDCGNDAHEPQNDYFYIDDIILEEVDRCNLEEPCSPTDGYIEPLSFHYLTEENSNLIIDGLENVSLAKNIKISGLNGAVDIILPDKYCPNGIDYVHWSGRSSGGSALAAGTYVWEMDLYNDCDFMHVTIVLYLENLTPKPALPDNFDCNQSIVQLLECCEADPNLFINNETIEGSGIINFHAVNNLTISNTLIKSSATNVTFKAGSEIILNPGFETEDGAVVDMIIEPCEGSKTKKNDSIYQKNLIGNFYDGVYSPKDKELSNETICISETSVTIYPNPANNFFEIYINFSDNINNESLSISITDISGKEYHRETINQENTRIYKDKINISNYTSGIYFINITGNQFTQTKKLIIN